MTEFKNNTDKELIQSIADKRELLRVFRFGIAGSKTRNVKEGMNIRKDIARILTEISSRKNNEK
ncbi:MAG: 50S ribosomal protein L29 [Patescibacteria group bacterium]|nr:50S ribosomal protein L29 [Patescibacteria group bacterium]